MTPEQYNTMRWEREVEERNKALTDEELDAMLPGEGYKVLEAPASYVPIRTPARKLLATPTPYGGQTPGFYAMPDEDRGQVPKYPSYPSTRSQCSYFQIFNNSGHSPLEPRPRPPHHPRLSTFRRPPRACPRSSPKTTSTSRPCCARLRRRS
jgi:hypothetical protein